MITIDAKKFALPVKETKKKCSELRSFLKSDKLDLGDPKTLQLYNKCLFFVLEDIVLEFKDETNLIPTCGLRRALISIIISKYNPKQIIDIGTGAYAIMALLFAKKNIPVIATELNDNSFNSAKKMIKLNKLENKINLLKSSGGILSWLDIPNHVDCVISLPPYYGSETRMPSNKKGFLGVDSELYSNGAAENFALLLIKEWLSVRNQVKNLCILWKNKDTMDIAIKYIKDANLSTSISIEPFKIIAGTRNRFFTVFSSK